MAVLVLLLLCRLSSSRMQRGSAFQATESLPHSKVHWFNQKARPFLSQGEALKHSSKPPPCIRAHALFVMIVYSNRGITECKIQPSNVDSPWFTFCSAVVLAIYNFSEFDQQVGDSAGPGCKAALQEITKLRRPTTSFRWSSTEEQVWCFYDMLFEAHELTWITVRQIEAGVKCIDVIYTLWWKDMENTIPQINGAAAQIPPTEIERLPPKLSLTEYQVGSPFVGLTQTAVVVVERL
ncbi:hypothetical protein HPP92_021024 [Vanilla planifolia]|uniref:Uncharacterized protein n=1 Tax=Vanilla planifolia TaxID=51239 RepID=A0A835Q091_VANPL|nr:hypothetical protein HPP92_021024 [Vanilla planifolia]